MQLEVKGIKVTLSNETDSSRAYTVRADVSKQNEQVGINEGQVTSLEGISQAYFNNGENSPLNVNFSSVEITPEEQNAIFEHIQDFIASTKTKFATLEVAIM